jgi:hypothetical protein
MHPRQALTHGLWLLAGIILRYCCTLLPANYLLYMLLSMS